MIEVHVTAPLERLHSLGTDTLVIRANPKGGWTGYLDFSEFRFSVLRIPADRLNILTRSPQKAMGYLFPDGWDFLDTSFLPGILEQR